jgi:hypothetical protein
MKNEENYNYAVYVAYESIINGQRVGERKTIPGIIKFKHQHLIFVNP